MSTTLLLCIQINVDTQLQLFGVRNEKKPKVKEVEK